MPLSRVVKQLHSTRLSATVALLAISIAASRAQVATVPIRLDHNRILLKAGIRLPGGKVEQVNVWLDNGTPDMSISERLAKQLGLKIWHDSARDEDLAAPLEGMSIGRLRVDLSRLKQVVVEKGKTVGAGLDADMNLPASVLYRYDVVIDYPGRSLTLASQGTLRFTGKAIPGHFNPENHLIQLPAVLDAENFNLALDVGTPVTFIDGALLLKFSTGHPQWPSMYGAVGIANLWGLADEPDWHLLKVTGLTYANIPFPEMIAVSFPTDRLAYFQKRAGLPTAGLMGAAPLLNYKLGIDYAHGIVYFERLAKSVGRNMNLIGITLRPETDGSYRILGVASDRERPAVPGVHQGDLLVKINGRSVNGLSMGEIWELLRGPVGKRKALTLQRDGRQFTVVALSRCFLCKI